MDKSAATSATTGRPPVRFFEQPDVDSSSTATIDERSATTTTTVLQPSISQRSQAPKGCHGGQQPQQQQQQSASAAGMSINRQHLSARVKTITGKLLESHGAELRRTLFSLRQIFQDDPELAAEFIDSDGLECLMKVAIDADQIHQNYILRALGQLIAYPSGMNGLTRHNETIRWLYTLLASQHRLVVKTSIKLLLLFVEHSDNNCLHFCRSIKSVEESKGALLWTTIIGLFKPQVAISNSSSSGTSTSNAKQDTSQANNQLQHHQDVGLLIDAMTLVNKTLAGIPDQDTYYDFVDPLEELGLEQIMKKYSSVDAQLSEQFELYEQVLKAEDHDDNVQQDNNSGNNQHATTVAASSKITTTASAAATANKMVTRDNQQKPTASEELGGGILDEQQQQQQEQFRRRSKRASQQQEQQQQQPQLEQQPNSGDENVGEINDDNYESANDESNESNRTTTTTPTAPVEQPKRQHLQGQPARYGNSSSSSSTSSSSQHQQQNLARGKQQRASISSCSSSDSYASYGSGYASGSGNSTDHELKQQKSALSGTVNKGNEAGTAETNDDVGGQALAATDSSGSKCKADEHDDDDDDDDDGQGVDDDSQLKQHLSELEQLTDELASRNIFGNLGQPVQSTSKHFSSTIKSTSSNSSSILSTGSANLSSLSIAAVANVVDDTTPTKSEAQTPNGSGGNNESRSTTATPTSTNQLNATSSSYTPAYLTHRASNGEMAYQAQLARQNHQYARPAATSTASAQQTTSNGGVTANHHHQAQPKQEPYYHNLFQWEQLVSKGVTRPLLINDLDFTDLRDEDDCDLLNASNNGGANGGNIAKGRNQATGEPLTISIPGSQHLNGSMTDEIDSGTGTGSPNKVGASGTPASAPPPMPPPPISPWFNTIAGSRPQSQFMSSPSPPYEFPGAGSQQQSSGEFNRDQSPANSTYSNYSRNSVCVPQTSTPTRDSAAHHHQYNTMQPLTSLRSASSMSSLLFGNNGKYANKRKKTMKLFWKEVREDRSLLSKLTKKRTIWDEIKPVQIDTQKLEHLFESKAKDLLLSKSRNGLDGLNQRKVKITVLDAKRSNAINIGMTKLPPMRTIKSAILKMDSSIMNREGIEKILTTMMPSEEEKSRIIEAQLANPDTPLGTAEQFLLNLASISALEARLKLWAFQLDYAQIEKEVAEPLMDLKQAIEEIERSETFRIILGTLLAIGNFLNSTNVKGFQIDYLEKVPEVKDTVHKHSLLHHLCLFIQEKYDPQLTSDLYSEFSAVNRASKVDYTEVAKNLKKMQQDCKASWDYLKIVAKHDGLANLMNACGSSVTGANSSITSSSSSSSSNDSSSVIAGQQPKSSGKLNNLSKLSMITTVISSDNSSSNVGGVGPSSGEQQTSSPKQLKTKVSDFLTDCAERIMVLMVIHRRVMNRFQKLLVYLGCPSHQIKQTQPQQILKVINEFALEYRTKRERVREMLMKKQQCQHHHNHHGNRWQMNRTRWAGSQQCIDSLGYNHPMNRPCSTASSCADSMCSVSLAGDPRHPLANQQQHHVAGNRAGSPSGFSQISNYSDYLFDQSCCNSRQQSVTPVPSEKTGGIMNNHFNQRPNSMSVSMFDLQNQQNCRGETGASGIMNGTTLSEGAHADNRNEGERARQKDEQLRRLLGAGKSFDGACNDLYQMGHWSTTMARVTRHPPLAQGPKQRAASMDDDATAGADISNDPRRQQSSYYRYLHNDNCMDDSLEQNSDDEILQSLVRTATAKSSHSNHQNSSHGNRSTPGSSHSSQANRSARSKILSRFSCDRKSLRRTLRSGLELSNVG